MVDVHANLKKVCIFTMPNALLIDASLKLSAANHDQLTHTLLCVCLLTNAKIPQAPECLDLYPILMEPYTLYINSGVEHCSVWWQPDVCLQHGPGSASGTGAECTPCS